MGTVEGFPAPAIIGTIKTFGTIGPAYQIIEPIEHLKDGDWMLKIKLLETGENAEYRYTHAINDPKAA
ncbi:MAG: DUF5397 family protein [Methylomonas sp.]